MTSSSRWPISLLSYVSAYPPPEEGHFFFFVGGGGNALPTPSLSFLKLWTSFSCISQCFLKPAANSRLPDQHFNRLIKTTRGKYRQPIIALDSTNLHSLAVSTVKVSCALLIQERPTDNRKSNNSGYIWKFKRSNIEQRNGGYNKKHLLLQQ